MSHLTVPRLQDDNPVGTIEALPVDRVEDDPKFGTRLHLSQTLRQRIEPNSIQHCGRDIRCGAELVITPRIEHMFATIPTPRDRFHTVVRIS
jgi:hypothetical protein